MDEKSKKLMLDNISFFKEFVLRTNSFQNSTINIIRVIYFLTQFKNFDEIKVVITLLKRVDFLDSNRITSLLQSAYGKIEKEYLTNPIISSLGGIQDSSAVICYQLLKSLFDDENQTLKKIVNIDNLGNHIASDSPSAIILFDDNITSGTQLECFFEELIIGKQDPEFFKKPLDESQIDIIKKIPIRICYAIQLAEGSNDIVEKIKNKYRLDLKVYSGRVDYNNYLDFNANVLETKEEANLAKEFLSEIAKQLYSDKKWSSETVYSRVLGYGNLGKLTVFYYNVPKSLIPVFWKFGYVNGRPWFPLFPETQEQKKISRSNETFDFITLEAIKSWLSSGINKRTPSLTFGVFFNSKVSSEITLQIPSKEFIREKFMQRITIEKLPYIENKVNPYGRLTVFLEKYPKHILSEIDYNNYKDAVDNYNSKLDDFYIALEEYIFKLSSSKDVEFILRNDGNISATNFVIKLFYNSGKIIINDFEDSGPSFVQTIPNINSFYTTENSQVKIISKNFLSLETPISQVLIPESLNSDVNYEYKIQNSRLGHNDDYRHSVLFIRNDCSKKAMEIPYELNFEEDSKTFDGNITFKYEEINSIDLDVVEKIIDEIHRFKDIITFNYEI
nr:hypothetical protein [uncultured Flavobacterium sp.]